MRDYRMRLRKQLFLVWGSVVLSCRTSVTVFF